MKQIQNIQERSINSKETLIHALKIMDATGFRSLLVVSEDDLYEGILSIGDIQRSIIKNMPFETPVRNILRQNPRIARMDTPIEVIKEVMLKYRMEFLPVIDGANHIHKIYFWEELFIEKSLPPQKQFNLPVIIMAGGIGSRLKPLTNVLPKPLIPIGEKTIIEEIFERFGNHGCNDFFISINYKAEMIEYYLQNIGIDYNLKFFKEDKPRGTAGSLSLLKGIVNTTFFVSNCDILVEQDYSEILDYHKINKNEITIVAALKHYPIAYGTIETGENGRLLKLTEKPEVTFKINSGMYILEPHLLEEIPDNQVFHITTLIEIVKKRNGKIGVFPVSEKSWTDLGNWDDYQKRMK